MSPSPCPHCGQTHPSYARFCPSTGKSLPVPQTESPSVSCPHCYESVKAEWLICPHCGKKISESKREKSSPLLWIVLTAGGLALSLIAGLIWLFNFRDQATINWIAGNAPEPIAQLIATFTPTPTPTPTATFTPTFTPTSTPTNTPTRTPTFTPTFTPSNTPTRTFTPTFTRIPPTPTPILVSLEIVNDHCVSLDIYLNDRNIGTVSAGSSRTFSVRVGGYSIYACNVGTLNCSETNTYDIFSSRSIHYWPASSCDPEPEPTRYTSSFSSLLPRRATVGQIAQVGGLLSSAFVGGLILISGQLLRSLQDPKQKRGRQNTQTRLK